MIIAKSVSMQTQTRRKSTRLNKKENEEKTKKYQCNSHSIRRMSWVVTKSKSWKQKGHTNHPTSATKPKTHSARKKNIAFF
jgi:hypothetical protein